MNFIFSAAPLQAVAVESSPPVALHFCAGIGAQEGQGIAVDKNGIISATGQFTGSFGAYGAFDYHLAAYSPTGQVLWAQRARTSGPRVER